MLIFFGWLMFLGFGVWAAYEYREELKSKRTWKELEKYANDSDDDGD